MSAFTFRPAKRENVPLLIGVAGGTGSGKTLSALKLASGLAGDKPFAVIDTEARRALHYADDFRFEHTELRPPFRPDAYSAAIQAADAAHYPVIVVDSASHEHAGEGGLLDWHEEELSRMAGDDYKRREALTFAAWIKPKQSHKQMVNRLLQLRSHLILCFRAEEKIEIVKEGGKTIVRPKRSLTGLDGWIPVCEKNLPYELTLSFLLTAEAPGVPRPIKLQEQHRPFVPLDRPLSEEAGRLLGEWATGGSSPTPAPPSTVAAAREDDVEAFLELAARVSPEAHERAVEAIVKQRGSHDGTVDAKWLGRQHAKLSDLVPPEPLEVEGSIFEGMLPPAVKEHA